MATKKPSPAQLAARKLFAQRAKAGTLSRRPVKKSAAKKRVVKKNPAPTSIDAVIKAMEKNESDARNAKITFAAFSKRRDELEKLRSQAMAGINQRIARRAKNPISKAAPAMRYTLKVRGKIMARASDTATAQGIAQWLADLYKTPVELIDSK